MLLVDLDLLAAVAEAVWEVNMNPFKHTSIVLKHLRAKSSEVVLFYSGGKDSLVLLDLLAPHFDKIYCVFMYFVPDLQHIEPHLTWINRYPNAELIRLPHWMTGYYMKNGYYSFHRPNDKLKAFKQVDVENKAKELTGCEWIVFGHKQADSMNRRLMLRGYTFDAINEKNKKVYPLSLWKKDQVKQYINLKRIIKPIAYGGKNSNGLDLNIDVFLYLRKNYPNDLEQIFKVFPLSQQILFEYDYNK